MELNQPIQGFASILLRKRRESNPQSFYTQPISSRCPRPFGPLPFGGECEIRTHGPLSSEPPVFKTGVLNQSTNSPYWGNITYYITTGSGWIRTNIHPCSSRRIRTLISRFVAECSVQLNYRTINKKSPNFWFGDFLMKY